MLLHCRPVKYNYTMPFENPNYCYPLGPFIVVMASVGLAMDALTWLLPHYVVWRLQLPLVHRLAITAIFAFGLMFSFLPSAPSSLLLTASQHHHHRSSPYSGPVPNPIPGQ